MRENGIRARHRRRYRVTTDSKHKLPVAENLLNREFRPAEPNQVFSSDITYIWTDEGWLYLAVVLDLFNREVVCWSIKPRMTANLVTDALTMAWFRHRPAPGALCHSDRGSQYASHEFQRKLATYSMRYSMSRKGNCWDNAPTESFFNGVKNERVHATRYQTHQDAKTDLFEYIEGFTTAVVVIRRSALFLRNAFFGTGSGSADQGRGGITRDPWKAKNRGKLKYVDDGNDAAKHEYVRRPNGFSRGRCRGGDLAARYG
ncbi:hypothetical protein JCM10599A_65230 [Paraburkholderia kururiensis]